MGVGATISMAIRRRLLNQTKLLFALIDTKWRKELTALSKTYQITPLGYANHA